MEKDNRKYRICFIDYMWYVAEIWHERERTNLNGRMLLFWCWLFVLLIPLGFPPILRLFGWMIGLAIVQTGCSHVQFQILIRANFYFAPFAVAIVTANIVVSLAIAK